MSAATHVAERAMCMHFDSSTFFYLPIILYVAIILYIHLVFITVELLILMVQIFIYISFEEHACSTVRGSYHLSLVVRKSA